jgi:hypothetical protein
VRLRIAAAGNLLIMPFPSLAFRGAPSRPAVAHDHLVAPGTRRVKGELQLAPRNLQHGLIAKAAPLLEVQEAKPPGGIQGGARP